MAPERPGDARTRRRNPYLSATSLLLLATFLTTGALTTLTGLTERYSVWAMLVVAGAWIVCLAWGLLAEGRADKRVLAAAGLLAIAGLLSALLSGHPVYSVFYDSLAQLPLVAWYAMLVAFLVSSKLYFGRDVRSGLVLVLIASVYPALTGFLQGLGIGVSGGVLGVFGNSNYFVSVMIIMPPIALGLARTSASPRARIGWKTYAVFVSVVILLQQTLVGVVALPLVLLLVFALDPTLIHGSLSVPRALRVACTLAVACVLCALLAASMLPYATPSFVRRVTQPFGASALSRVELWRGAQRMWAERPLVGYGPGGFKLASLEHVDGWLLTETMTPDPLHVAPPSAHSLAWTTASTYGLIGVLSALCLLAVWLLALSGRKDASSAARSLRLSLVAGFFAYVVTQFTVPISVAQGLLPAVIAGLAVASERRARVRGGGERVWVRVAFTVAGAVFLVMAVASATAYWAYASMDPNNVVGSLDRYDLAMKLQPGDPFYQLKRVEYGILTADSDETARFYRDEVSQAAGVSKEYAPALVGLAEVSMNQAERQGRRDLSWERDLLREAQDMSGEFPTLVAQELHLAGLSGDRNEMRKALATALRHRGAYPLLDVYIDRVEQVLDSGGS